MLRHAVEWGMDFLDTTNACGPDANELQIREALLPYPDDLVIATKGGRVRPGPGEWTPVGRPDRLRERLEGSLQRLGVERIDPYQHHTPDPDVPCAETIGARPVRECRRQHDPTRAHPYIHASAHPRIRPSAIRRHPDAPRETRSRP